MQNEHPFIHKQAQDWLIKLETGAMAEGDEDRFTDWLAEDELHGEIFYEVEQAWQLMGQVDAEQVNDPIEQTQVESVTGEAQQLVLNQTSGWFSRHLLPIAATVMFTLTSMIWWQEAYYVMSTDHYTFTGTRDEVTLADGSVVTLNTDSAIDVEFDQKTRLIELINGEINVQVAPNQNRPFVVKAGDMYVTALGTAFIVRKQADAPPSVIVTEHSVNVAGLSPTLKPVILEEGEQVSLLEQQESFTAIKQVDQTQAAAWMNGKYVFIDRTLEEVIKELGRYYDGRMMIRDETLKSLRISGVLDIDDPVRSLQNLAQSIPIAVTTLSPYLTFIDQE